MCSEEERERLWCVRRDTFDAGLAAAAAACGAAVMDNITVRDVRVTGQHLEVVGSLGPDGPAWWATSDYVIGADGATGPTGRRAGISLRRRAAIAMEVEIPHDWGSDAGLLNSWTIHIEYGTIRNGYAWAFPKADHVNIGAGSFRNAEESRIPHLRRVLSDVVARMAQAVGSSVETPDARVHFHPLPIWAGKARLTDRTGRILLTGDAASLVNPLFGDGILNAVRSGVLAAECVASAQTDRYTEVLYDELGCDLDAADRISRLFYAMPELCYRVGIQRPTATLTASRLLCGELRYRDVAGRVIRRITEALSPFKDRRAGIRFAD
jgi:flavin-dependent dehydrogenase